MNDRYTDQPLPSVATGWGLSGIGGTATDDRWAVGTVMQHPARAVALHYDGHAWQHVAASHTAVHLSDVVALANDGIWAGGYQTSAGRGHGPRRPFAMHWDGTTWSTRDLDDQAGQISQLVTADPSGRVYTASLPRPMSPTPWRCRRPPGCGAHGVTPTPRTPACRVAPQR